MTLMDDSEENKAEDEAVVSGESKDVSEFDVQLAARARAYTQFRRVPLYSIVDLAECGYPSHLHALAAHIKQPEFPLLFSQFLYKCFHPEVQVAPSTLEECPTFDGAIKVYHSAVATLPFLLTTSSITMPTSSLEGGRMYLTSYHIITS